MLGELLVSKGHISEAQLVSGLSRHFSSGDRLGECLVNMGHVSEEVMLSCVAEQSGLTYVADIPDEHLTARTRGLLSYQDAVRLCAVMGEYDDELICYCNDATELASLLDSIGSPTIILAKKSAIRTSIDKAYRAVA